ncbi:MAG TPA: hypothetical protein VK737_08935 [Opitutales bacterium]|jgi:hypothetical protein|nr:hypothetical protein [Opitutales bacterium]
MKPAAPTNPTPAADEGTGLPGLRTWNAVYWLVVAEFVVTVGLLVALMRMFS